MKVIIFGTGKFYEKCKSSIKKDNELIAFIDNDPTKWGKLLDGIVVYPVSDLDKLEYDVVFLLSVYYLDMQKQLRTMGVPKEKIYNMNHIEFLCEGEPVQWYGKLPVECHCKKILIFSHALTSTGAQNVLFQSVQVLKKHNFQVIVVSGTDGILRKRFRELDIPVVIIRDIYAKNREITQLCTWAEVIIVNTLLLYETVIELIKQKKPILWWIHETGFLEYIELEDFSEIEKNNNIAIYAVSPLVKRKIIEHYGMNFNLRELCYGLPDYGEYGNICKESQKMIFAHIAAISYIKGQDLFLQAISRLPEYIREKAEFWIVGPGKLSESLFMLSEKYSCVKVKGEIDNTQIMDIYRTVDVVTCVSREDAMPVVVAEGCMMKKASVVSNATGVADFIEHGRTGLIFNSENVDELSYWLKWAVEHPLEIKQMGINSREIYDKYFCIDVHENNLLVAIDNAIV